MEYKGKQLYEELPYHANSLRAEYRDSVDRYLEQLKNEDNAARRARFSSESFPAQQESLRQEFIAMLGKPLTEYETYSKTVPSVTQTRIGCDEMAEIFRIQLEVMPGFFSYGLLFVPHEAIQPKMPLVIFQHGGGGTPELCSDIYGPNNYNRGLHRVLERGVAVFAPQLLLWNTAAAKETMPSYPVPFDRYQVDSHLKHCGSSITALEIFCIRRAIDYLSTLDFLDSSRIGMHGLSYGGFFTLYTTAAEPRICSAYSVASFNDRNCAGCLDWYWFQSSQKFHDAEVAALCAPRQLYLEVGVKDPVFPWEPATNESKHALRYYESFGAAEHIRFNAWDGAHTVSDTDEGYDFFFAPLIP